MADSTVDSVREILESAHVISGLVERYGEDNIVQLMSTYEQLIAKYGTVDAVVEIVKLVAKQGSPYLRTKPSTPSEAEPKQPRKRATKAEMSALRKNLADFIEERNAQDKPASVEDAVAAFPEQDQRAIARVFKEIAERDNAANL